MKLISVFLLAPMIDWIKYLYISELSLIPRNVSNERVEDPESWLGATTQGEEGFEWLTNDVVNGVQITIAAGLAVAVGGALGYGL